MHLLEERIKKDGKVYPGEVLKVSGFLNHLIDENLLDEIGKDISARFSGRGVNKILTIEASGIAIACAAARYMQVPVLFAKKSKTINISSDVYSADVVSYTHGNVSKICVDKAYLTNADNVLIIDDFLARGEAVRGLISLIDQAGAKLAGVSVAIEKGFQPGGAQLRAQGIDVYSLAIIDSMSDDSLTLRQQ